MNLAKKTTQFIKNKKSIILIFFVFLFVFAPLTSVLADETYPDKMNPETWAKFENAVKMATRSPFSLSDVVYKVGSWIAQGLSTLAGQIILLEHKILAMVLDIKNFSTMPFVQMGWSLVRDISYIFIVAFLVFIAIAIILSLEKYQVKKLLFKVILMAILINFSLTIGGMIIDFSQVLLKWFLFAPLQEKTTIGLENGLSNVMNYHKLWAAEPRQEEFSLLVVLLKLIFVVIFAFMCALVYGAFVIILIIRMLWLWILLILSPFAWMSWAFPFPEISKYFKQWWDKFIQWCFTAPIMAFFVFLALILPIATNGNGQPTSKDILEKAGQTDIELMEKNENADALFTSENQVSTFNISTVFMMLTSLGLMFAGVMAGGGKTAGVADWVGKTMKSAGTKTAKGIGGYAGRRVARRAGARGLKMASGIGKGWNKLREKAEGTVFARPLGGIEKLARSSGIGQAVAGAIDVNREALVKGGEKDISRLDDKQLTQKWDRLTKWQKAAAVKRLGPEKLDDKQYEFARSLYKDESMAKELKDLEKANPHRTEEFKQLAYGFTNLKNEKIDEINKEREERGEEKLDRIGTEGSSPDLVAKGNNLAGKEEISGADKDTWYAGKSEKEAQYLQTLVDKFSRFDFDKVDEKFFETAPPAVIEAVAAVASQRGFSEVGAKVLSKISDKEKAEQFLKSVSDNAVGEKREEKRKYLEDQGWVSNTKQRGKGKVVGTEKMPIMGVWSLSMDDYISPNKEEEEEEGEGGGEKPEGGNEAPQSETPQPKSRILMTPGAEFEARKRARKEKQKEKREEESFEEKTPATKVGPVLQEFSSEEFSRKAGEMMESHRQKREDEINKAQNKKWNPDKELDEMKERDVFEK